MLKKVITLLQAHRTTVEEAERVFAKAQKQINENYRGTMQASKLGEARTILNETIQESLKVTDEEIKKIFKDLNEKLQKVITEPVAVGFADTLEVIKALKNPSKAELDAIVASYKNNYLCYRAISDAVGGAISGYSVVTIDRVQELAGTLESKITRTLYGGNVQGYTYRVLEKGQEIETASKVFEDFLEGRYDSVGKSLSEKEDQHDQNL